MAPRLKPARDFTLSNRRIFIMPTRAGMGYLLVVLVLWLTGTNFGNNLVLALAFFLSALFVVCIHHAFFNVSGLRVESLRSAPCFLGEDGEVELRVSCAQKHQKEALSLSLGGGAEIWVDLIEHSEVIVKLFVPAQHRGWYFPPKLKLESRFPLGIIRCWSLMVLDQPILVYPQPISGGDLPQVPSEDPEGEQFPEPGAEDFSGFKSYFPGVSPKHIAWKHYARGQGLHVKEYTSYQTQTLWLDWDAFVGLGTELRLSRLCFWVLKLSATPAAYGLRLPGVEIKPGQGVEHRQQILRHLALFQAPKTPPYGYADEPLRRPDEIIAHDHKGRGR